MTTPRASCHLSGPQGMDSNLIAFRCRKMFCGIWNSPKRESRIRLKRILRTAVRWLYNILFTLLFWVASPWLLLRLRRRGQWKAGFSQRFGRYAPDAIPELKPGGRRLWLHAVSVGEVNTCLQFLKALEARLPDVQIIVTATTTTGMAELRKKLPPNITAVYFPVDRRRFVRRALDAIQPDAVILVEREIWPNFLWELRERTIPLFLINARISEHSYRACTRYQFLFRPLYRIFERVAAQARMDSDRLRDVGCRPEALYVTGSMKFDSANAAPALSVNARELFVQAGWREGSPILLGGSTHDGEERVLAEMADRLRVKVPSLFLVLVPRHFERCPEVSAQLTALGVPHVRRSSLTSRAKPVESPGNCLLVDSTGELTAFYAEADLVFVGKSLCARGGQNPIEPAALKKAMVFGPNMQNFPGVTHQLLANEAAVQVGDAQELEHALSGLLQSAEKRMALGQNAFEVVQQNLGATDRTVTLVVGALETRWSR